MPPRARKEFVWTDDEAELLLNVTIEYKTAKAAESVDWESVKSKYADIFELFKAQLPGDGHEVEGTRDFPHKPDEITKQIVTSKLKAIRLKYRQAVDSGKRSGHGRVVLLYFELCEKVWGGSPATEQIVGGVESSDLSSDLPSAAEGSSSLAQDDDDEDTQSDDTRETSGEPSDPSVTLQQSTVQKRRQLLDKKLDNYRQEKLKRKLPVDMQLLNCARDELEVKRRFVDRMDEMDKKYAENMDKMSRNMEKLTESIADGFSLLRNMVMFQQQPSTMYPPPHVPPYPPYMHGSRTRSFSPVPSYPPRSTSSIHPETLSDQFEDDSFNWKED